MRCMRKIYICLLISICLIGIAGCDVKENGQKKETLAEANEKPVIIRMMTMGEAPKEGMNEIYEQLDALTMRDFGCIVRVDFYSWGDETELMKRIVASREYDIYGTGAWGDYEELSRLNAFLQLDGWLEKVPQLVQAMKLGDENLLDSVRVDGKLYTVPRKVGQSGGYGFFYREDLRKEWGLEPINSLETVEAYLYRAEVEFPQYAMINDKRFFNSLKQLILGEKYYMINTYVCVRKDEPGKIVSIFDCPEYLEALKIAQKWYQDGIIAQDILSVQQNNTMPTLALMKAGKLPLEFANHLTAISNNYILPIVDSIPSCELGWLDYALLTDNQFLNYKSNAKGQMLAIRASTEEPEIAIRLIEKMYTDSEYYDLLVYGAENINYKLTESGQVSYDGILPENKLRGQTGLENEDLSRTVHYSDAWNHTIDNLNEEVRKQIEKNGTYFLDGVSFDESILDEQINEIYQYEIFPLECGLASDCEKELEQAKEKLNQAGYQDYLNSVQKQLDNSMGRKNMEGK